MKHHLFSLHFLEKVTPYFAIWHRNGQCDLLSPKLLKIWRISLENLNENLSDHFQKMKLIRPFESIISVPLLEELTDIEELNARWNHLTKAPTFPKAKVYVGIQFDDEIPLDYGPVENVK